MEKVDVRAGENRQDAHLKRNAHGQIPTLELDNGSYLSEITAICEYLEDRNPKPALIGSTTEEDIGYRPDGGVVKTSLKADRDQSSSDWPIGNTPFSRSTGKA
jgi:hypothetical protein